MSQEHKQAPLELASDIAVGIGVSVMAVTATGLVLAKDAACKTRKAIGKTRAYKRTVEFGKELILPIRRPITEILEIRYKNKLDETMKTLEEIEQKRNPDQKN